MDKNKLPDNIKDFSEHGLPPLLVEYDEAVERLHDYTQDLDNAYIGSPSSEFSALPDGTIVDGNGSDWAPQELRDHAWELIVLADVAEAWEKSFNA